MAVSNLSPYQQAIQSVAGRGKGASVDAATLGRIADSIFGPAPVPPGSQILYQDAQQVRWIDPEGYEHVAMRSLDGRDPGAGQWRDQTNRPAILPPPQGQQDLIGQLTGGQGVQADFQRIRDLTAQLQQPATLAALDPETQAALQAITQNTLAQLKQQFEQDQANQLAALFGNRIQSSSIATNALGQLLQNQGLVTSQALSDAATRELGTRQFITDTNRAQLATALQGLLGGAGLQTDLLTNLTGQQTQRDIAGGGLNLDYAKLLESARQGNLNFELGQQDADMRLAQSRSVLSKILQGIGAGGAAAGGIGTLLGAIGTFKPKPKPA